MGMISEFKEFAFKGNMLDMAVGIIIGAAFGTVITSLVKDVIMPPIGLAMGGVDFGSLAIPLKEAAGGAEAVAIKYGSFINNLISFLVVAFVVFLLVKAVNAAKKAMEEEAAAAPPPEPSTSEKLLMEIRDNLSK